MSTAFKIGRTIKKKKKTLKYLIIVKFMGVFNSTIYLIEFLWLLVWCRLFFHEVRRWKINLRIYHVSVQFCWSTVMHFCGITIYS